MAVGVQQDLHARPVGADGAHKPTRKGLISLPRGRLARRTTAVDEPTLAAEHDDQLEAVLFIMGVEQRQLLTAVDSVQRGVGVEGDALGRVGDEAQWRSIIGQPSASARARRAGSPAARSSVASIDRVAKASLGPPPSDDSNPPWNLTSTRLPETGERSGSGSVGPFMLRAARLKSEGSA